MAKKNFFMALGLATVAMAAQAQKTPVASVDFEEGCPKYTTEWALTPGGIYGDWVNVKEGDVWNEADPNAHNGEYCLSAKNGDAVSGQQWQRGFKIGGLDLKDATSYRVTFWMKSTADFKSSISIGREYFDNELKTPSGTSYNYNFGNTGGEWKRIQFVTFNTSKELLDADCLSRYGAEDVKLPESEDIPEAWRGQVIGNGAEGFLPKSYFVVINMFNPGEYYLDDIVVEENVTLAGVTHNDMCIRVDFGYPTNIAALAKANGGALLLDPSCVTVTDPDGEPVAISSVECKESGYLCIFAEDGYEEDAKYTVSFTPGENCPIVYTTDKRPSIDVENEVKVFAFADEVTEYNEDIDDVPDSWKAPEFVSADPENNSFDLPNDFGKVAFKFNKNVDISSASAYYSANGKQTQLPEIDVDAEDPTVAIVKVPTLADGEYEITILDVMSEFGQGADPVSIKVEVGKSGDESESETVYSTDSTFSVVANGCFPIGWLSNDNGTIHQYGLTENGEVWNYNWGGNVGGGGCRAMTGYSGEFQNGAIYWRSMNGENKLGTLTFGEQVKDFIVDGVVDPEMDPRIALILEPRKYQVTIKMAAWKNLNGNTDEISEDNAPKFTFTVEDLNGNILAEFANQVAMPNVNGNQNVNVKNATLNQCDFTVPEKGYYMIKCSTTQPNGEYLLGAVNIVTMPSKSAYYHQMVNRAIESVSDVDSLVNEDIDKYGGKDYQAYQAVIAEGKEGKFTSPSAAEALVVKIQEAAATVKARISDIDEYDLKVVEGYTAIAELEGTKYLELSEIKDAMNLVDQCSAYPAESMDNATLGMVLKNLKAAVFTLKNIKNVDSTKTWGIQKAMQTAYALNAANEDLQAKVAANIGNNRDLAAEINTASTKKLLEDIVNGVLSDTIYTEIKLDGNDVYTNLNPDNLLEAVKFEGAKGLEMTGFINNPKMYRELNVEGVEGWAITSGAEDHSLNIAYSFNPTEDNPIGNSGINIYGEADYDMSQIITELPAGYYHVVLKTRTPVVDKTADFEKIFYYNAQESVTGEWDKYIYAIGDELESYVAPFLGNADLPTIIPNVKVENGDLAIGIHEHYVSGLAMKHEDNTPQSFWTGTTRVSDAHIYFVAPIEGHDYKADLEEILSADATEATEKAPIVRIVTIGGFDVKSYNKGVNIAIDANGTVTKVLK